MDHSQIEALIAERKAERSAYAEIQRVDADTLNINGHIYVIDTNVQDAFDLGEFSNQFNPVFTHYDYIVGDWGYGQLRLKGFYRDDRNVTEDLRYRSIQDYLLETANLGASYFIVKNLDPVARPVGTKASFAVPAPHADKKKNHAKRKRTGRHQHQPRPGKAAKSGPTKRKRQFTIRQKSED
ncbi:YutD family protein [Fructilactobacillus ixorae]|uniref:YutD family protein n=1 Tax=Fructilactobacillus ixorae TaxID=1750535 RepID=A0ABY5C5E8_9LACO|nr:YutD family protein [Fructilactobacillus ixorae]USS93792.1 YutD family protein [Fructilactobacillus ixorae]